MISATILLISSVIMLCANDAVSFVPVSFSTAGLGHLKDQRRQSQFLVKDQQQQQLKMRCSNRAVCAIGTALFAEEGEGEKETTSSDDAEAATEAKGDDGDSSSSSSSANDILNSPAFLKRKLEVLESDIAKVDEKISDANKVYEENKAEWGSQLDDLRKEYINIQDRMKEKMKAGAAVANIEIARKMLNVLDNYERAFGVVTPETDEEKAVEASYKETYSMILKQFQDIGVKQVQTVGTEFNYEFHQAVMMRPDEDYEEGMVCEELAKGFAMEDGTLIRAAMVVVAA